MADPTLKDVLAAIARLEKSQNELLKGQNELRTEMHKRFDDLDAELDKHASVTHRKIEADITALKKRPPARTGRAPRRRKAKTTEASPASGLRVRRVHGRTKRPETARFRGSLTLTRSRKASPNPTRAFSY